MEVDMSLFSPFPCLLSGSYRFPDLGQLVGWPWFGQLILGILRAGADPKTVYRLLGSHNPGHKCSSQDLGRRSLPGASVRFHGGGSSYWPNGTGREAMRLVKRFGFQGGRLVSTELIFSLQIVSHMLLDSEVAPLAKD